MPPHCDTLDGPVVAAARRALETGNVSWILPWVPENAEHHLTEAFLQALQVRKQGGKAQELADYWFFETAVRVHRAGEGAPYTGLKPAGLDPGPVVPRAEEGIERGDATELIHYLVHTVEEVIQDKFDRVMAHKYYDPDNVPAAREYVQAMLGLTLFSHHLYTILTGGEPHGEGGTGGHVD